MAVLINFTERIDLDSDVFTLHTYEDANGQPILDVQEIRLPEHALEPDADIVLEVFKQNTKMRISCGTVASPHFPKGESLSEFAKLNSYNIRARVVSNNPQQRGLVLAVAERIRGGDSLEAQPSKALLRLQKVDLGSAIWRFRSDGSGPILLMNKQIDNSEMVLNSAMFRALVLPEFFRQAVLWVAHSVASAQEENSVVNNWIQYLSIIGCELDILDRSGSDQVDPEELDEWAADCAALFSKDIGALSALNMFTSDQED